MNQLSDETFALCLSFAHIRNVLVCRRVCKRMKYIIDSNPLLQIRVQLHVNNMVDSVSDTIPLCDQLSLLTDYRTFECYGHDKWITGGNIPYPFINDHDSSILGGLIFKGSTFVMRRYDTAELYIAQTPSTFRRRPFREWRVALPSATIRLAFDPYRDLLVTAERTSGSFETTLDVRSLIDGTRIRVPDRIRPPKENIEKLSIYGRYVALELSSPSTGDMKIEVWDWQTGHLVVFDSINVKPPFVFLSYRYILTGEVNMDYNRCAELNIVDVTTSQKRIVCHLRLPKFAYSRSSWSPRIDISVDDRPPQSPGEIFATSSRPQDKVVRVTLDANGERMEFYILTSTLLKWAGQRAGPLKWENWGSKNTRLVSSKTYPSPKVAIYGTRVFSMQHSTLTIYDFNQRPIDLESAQDDKMADVYLNTVDHPTDIFNPMFEQPVTTCLPFRWMSVDVESLMPGMAANTQIYPGEDSIVTVSGSGAVRYVRM